MTFHPIVTTFEPLTSAARARLKASLQKHGCKTPAVFWKDKKRGRLCIDGRHRLELCKELGIACPEATFKGSEEEAIALAQSLNDDRRQQTDEQITLRKTRISQAVALHAKGMSLRAIGDELSVSHEQARLYLEASGVKSDLTPEGGAKTTGKDGKTYTRKQPTLCERCARLGAVAGCNACKQARAAAAKAKANNKAYAARKDQYGNTLPKSCWDAKGDEWVSNSIKALEDLAKRFRANKFITGMDNRKGRLPFFDAAEWTGNAATIDNLFDELVEHLKVYRPAGLCPHCQGTKCAKCKSSGMVPAELYTEVMDDRPLPIPE